MKTGLPNPRITLEQWRCFVAVVEQGGFAQAAEALNKSQSTVSYAVNKMQSLLDMEVLEIKGRKAELTEAGKVMYREARQLLGDAASLEALVQPLKSCWEMELRLVVDEVFPMSVLMEALKAFEPLSRGTRVQLEEVILSGAEEALEQGRADLAIAYRVPQGFMGDPIFTMEFICVAHPEHPLFEHGRELSSDDLLKHVHIVIRDSGQYKNVDTGWLRSQQRWTVSSVQTSIQAVSQGLGFAWLPVEYVRPLIEAGRLKPVPLVQGGLRRGELYLIYGHPEHIGPATRQLARTLEVAVQQHQAKRAEESRA